jgi:hypothetical protein
MHTQPASPIDPLRSERGMALLVALLSIVLLTALGLGLVMTTMTETLITSNYSESNEATYAADAGVERVMQELLTTADWNRILQGEVRSSFVDGPPSGTRSLPGGGVVDLGGATNMLNCGKATTCSAQEMTARTVDRPYGDNNPRWQLYAYAPLADIIETNTIISPMYVAVWIADDPGENDANATLDGGPGLVDTDNDGVLDNPGTGIIMLRAEAFGPQGTHATIEVTTARTNTTELERGYTGQRGQDEQNRRARKAAVQAPGQALTRSDLNLSSQTGGFTVR